jgi:GNAT superfamily N-acetyltransferase
MTHTETCPDGQQRDCGYQELSPNPLSIRQLITGDIPRIWAIMAANIGPEYQRTFPDNPDPHALLMKEVNTYISNMQETLAHNGSTYFVAEVEGEVVGCLGCVHHSERMKQALLDANLVQQEKYEIAEFINFYVDPKQQHHGIGRSLWNETTNFTHENVKPDAIAFASRDVWKAAHAFYEKMGYKPFHKGRYLEFDTTFFVKAVEY